MCLHVFSFVDCVCLKNVLIPGMQGIRGGIGRDADPRPQAGTGGIERTTGKTQVLVQTEKHIRNNQLEAKEKIQGCSIPLGQEC